MISVVLMKGLGFPVRFVNAVQRNRYE